jgi:hypothetical protein
MNIRIGSFFLSLALLLTVAQNASGQWVQTNAPDGGIVNCFAASGGDLFVGTNGGIFISMDSGTTWTAIDSGLSSDPYVNALALENGNDSSPALFADLENSDDTNVFLSTNNGTSWTAKTIFYRYFDTIQNTIDTIVDAPDVNVLAFGTSKLYAGTEENGGFFRSTDSGTTWIAASNGLPLQGNVTVITTIGNEIFAGIPGNGVYRSINNGSSWTSANTGLTSDVTAFAVIGSDFFAATGTGVFRSTDNGTQWNAVNNGLTDPAVLTLTAWNGNLFSGTEDSGVFLSTNNGAGWAPVNTGLPPNTIVTAFAISGANTSSPILFAAADGGLWLRPLSEMVSQYTLVSLLDSLVFGNIVLGKDSTLTLTLRNAGNVADTIASISFVPSIGSFDFDGVTLPAVLQQGDSLRFSVTFTPTALGSEFDTLVVLSNAKELDIPASGVGIEMAGVAAAIVPEASLQVFPNPFSQSTTIQFTTTGQGPVQVSVVNLLGEQVALLFDGALDAGEHSYLWGNPSGLPDGTYFCIIRGMDNAQRAAIVISR